MAKLALVYGMRLFPVEDLQEVCEATVVLKDGRSARITMHLLEGEMEDLRRQFEHSVGACFDFYPEI